MERFYIFGELIIEPPRCGEHLEGWHGFAEMTVRAVVTEGMQARVDRRSDLFVSF